MPLFKLTSLNLNGIRSATSKGLADWLLQNGPDCICVQELRAQASDMQGRFEALAGLTGYFHFAVKKGYSGVGIYTRHGPTAVITGFGAPEFDAEGRYVELQFDNPLRPDFPKISIISCYFPSGASGDERQAAKFRFLAVFMPFLRACRAGREIVLCGDINIAHNEIDLKNFKGNRKNSGFLPEERAWMDALLRQNQSSPEVTVALDLQTASGCGMVDVYRHLHPHTTGEAYTWWSNRGQAYDKNVGWRIDYQIATPALAARARTAQICKAQRLSDHAPLTVEYAFEV